MPRHTPPPSLSQSARSALRLAAAGSLIAVLAVWGAVAQQSNGLRGAVSDDAASTEASTATDYDPQALDAASNGANIDGGLSDDPLGDDSSGIFADPPSPAPRRQPSTRRQRAAAARDALSGPAADQPADDDASKVRSGRPGAKNPAGLEEDEAANARAARARTDGQEDQEDDVRGRTPQALAIEALPRADASETNPFDPIGLRAGNFLLRPSVETGLTASSNASRTAGGSAGLLSETTLRLNARSDWSEHLATLDGFGTFRRSLSGDDEVKDVEGGVNAALRLDLSHEWQARTGLNYSVRTEEASSLDAVADAEEQPLRQILEGEAGLDKVLGKLRLSGTVSVERGWYGDAELASGSTVDQSDRDSTLGLVRLRTGYAVSPAITPFVEVEAGRRFYDDTGDGDRTANRIGARAGVALDLHDKVTGEIAAGWLRESFTSGDFEPIEGPTLLAALQWSPVRDTVVALNAATTVDGTAANGGSGALVQDLRLEVERTLRANLSAEAGIGASFRDYGGSQGTDVTLVGDIGATWWLNRWVGFTGRLRHERLESSQSGREYRENSVFVGTKLQY